MILPARVCVPEPSTGQAEPFRMEEEMSDRKTILGIVAEYDPFHNGHALHLSESRKAKLALPGRFGISREMGRSWPILTMWAIWEVI